jgi:hypothetical protein
MHIISELIYPTYYGYFKELAQALGEGDKKQGQNLLAQIKKMLNEINNPAEKLQVLFFYEAFSQRLNLTETSENGNLYLVNDDGQQIKQFNFMAEKFPVVTQAQEVANHLFLELLGEHGKFTFLDIGIGSGQQVVRLLQSAIEQNRQLTGITVIGIEPSAESLEKAEANLTAVALQLGLSITFTKIQNVLEKLNEEDWQRLEENMSPKIPLFLNASFALHHIQPVGIRREILRRLKRLNPTLFTIIEPHSDHVTPDLVQRFENAWHHYGLTFQAIDSIDASVEEKNNAKRIFFGREILDVIREKNRIEQFETAEMWLSKLIDAGFCPYEKIKDFEPVSFNQLINRQSYQNYLSMNVGEYPIVSLIGVR